VCERERERETKFNINLNNLLLNVVQIYQMKNCGRERKREREREREREKTSFDSEDFLNLMYSCRNFFSFLYNLERVELIKLFWSALTHSVM
jgi:hypothetical protein